MKQATASSHTYMYQDEPMIHVSHPARPEIVFQLLPLDSTHTNITALNLHIGTVYWMVQCVHKPTVDAQEFFKDKVKELMVAVQNTCYGIRVYPKDVGMVVLGSLTQQIY